MKRDWLLQRVPRITTSVFVTVVLLACATVVNAAEEKPGDRWRFTITPYLWLPSVSGSLKLGPRSGFGTVDLHTDPITYLENLQFAGMLDVQVEKGRWSLLADIIYLDFSNNDRKAHFPGALPGSGGFTAQADTDFQGFIFNISGAYSVFRSPHLNFDLLAGLRYIEVDADVKLDVVGPLPPLVGSRTFSKTGNFVDPIVGFKGKFELSKKWYLPYYFDIGGFGVDSDLTLQAFAGIGYRFSDLFSMVLGYRYLYYNFGNSNLMKDLNFYGGTLNFRFTF